MHKLTRFNSFGRANEDKEKKDTRPDDWHQHVTLPLSPQTYAVIQKQRAALNKIDSDTEDFNPTPGNEHKLSALGDLIRAMDLDGKEVIDYILANDLVKGIAAEEP